MEDNCCRVEGARERSRAFIYILLALLRFPVVHYVSHARVRLISFLLRTHVYG